MCKHPSTDSADRRRSGFTLAELLAATLSGAVLALTAGVILFFGFSAWRVNSAAVELQRDGTAALQLLRRPLREASLTDVAVQPERIDILTDAGPVAVYRSGADLVYDPDTAAAGDEMVVVNGRVRRFAAATEPAGVSVTLELEDGDAEMTLESTTTYRN